MGSESTEHTDQGQPARRPWALEALTAALVLVVALSPLAINLLTGGEGWFSWRMFSRVNGEIRYEIVEPDGTTEVGLDGLSYWDRGAHTGRRNLEALCRAHPEATGARRLLDGSLDDEVLCP